MIRYTVAAAADLENISEWYAARDLALARRIVMTIVARIDQLETYPAIGRVGRIAGTRELVVARLPYVVVYRPLEAANVIVRIVHGAMRWPPLP